MEKNDERNCLGFAFEPEAVIVGGGDFPTHPMAASWLEKIDKIVCCDGTANQWLAMGKRPWHIVGDGDSLSEEAKQTFAGLITIDPDQETNDQTKAVHFLQQQGMKRIAIVGGTGRREDHTIANISLLMEYLREGMDVRMFTDHGVFIPCRGSHTFSCPIGTAISIFGFQTNGLKSEGLAYPIYDFTSWWQGTLNHNIANTFRIDGEGDYLVFLNYENKKIRE